jgi:2-dehydropantoate 2-reductase
VKIAVVGAGAIGGLAAGYLKQKGEDVSLIGHADAVKAIKAAGLGISGARGKFNIPMDISEKITAQPDLIILATKTQDVGKAVIENLRFIDQATILTTQNGIVADDIVLKYVKPAKIISSIVMFAATYLEPGKIVHNFDGNWIIGKMFSHNDSKVSVVKEVLEKAFPTVITQDIKGMKYLKIFLNANNCIPAILGVSMQEAFADIELAKIGIAIWKEGLGVARRVGIALTSLPDFTLERFSKLLTLPDLEAAKALSNILTGLGKEPLYGSILQSIKRGRPSEIDYINGEFVSLAKKNEFDAPLNNILVDMVHTVEKTGKFFPKPELLERVKGFIK